MQEHAAVAGGWYRDPLGRHEYRYWDGAHWTDEASDAGVVVEDPMATPASTTEASTALDVPGAATIMPAVGTGTADVGVPLAGSFYQQSIVRNGGFVGPVSVQVAGSDVWISGRRVTAEIIDHLRLVNVITGVGFIAGGGLLVAAVVADIPALALLGLAMFVGVIVYSGIATQRARRAAQDFWVHFPAAAAEPVTTAHNWQANPGLWFVFLGIFLGLIGQWVVALARGQRKLTFTAPLDPGRRPARLVFKTPSTDASMAFVYAIRAAEAGALRPM